MSLLSGSLLVSIGIAVFCLLPWAIPALRANSKKLMVVGTLILLGFVGFDLIPETMEVAGPSTLILMAFSALFFSVFHVWADRKKHALVNCEGHDHSKEHHGLTSLLVSMMVHCFAGGVMLVTSFEISEALASAVLWSLVSHKGFEAISVASLLYERARSRTQLILAVSAYALAFPLGCLATIWIETSLAHVVELETIELAAMYATSIAIGSLFACLVQDFLLPSFKEIRQGLAARVRPVQPAQPAQPS